MASSALVAGSNLLQASPLVAFSDGKAAGKDAALNALSDAAAIGQMPGQAAIPSPTPFGDLLSEAVGQVDALESQARSAVEGLMSGKGVDVHQAMIATEKAEMGFELMLSVRNKALSAYQQILGMQF